MYISSIHILIYLNQDSSIYFIRRLLCGFDFIMNSNTSVTTFLYYVSNGILSQIIIKLYKVLACIVCIEFSFPTSTLLVVLIWTLARFGLLGRSMRNVLNNRYLKQNLQDKYLCRTRAIPIYYLYIYIQLAEERHDEMRCHVKTIFHFQIGNQIVCQFMKSQLYRVKPFFSSLHTYVHAYILHAIVHQ